MNENNTVETIERVYRRLEEPLQLGAHEVSGYWWMAILIPVLLLGFFYVVWMYVRDGRSVGWPWALLLGLLRCSVYLFLAWIFLLPAYQHWEQTNTKSRVLLMFDVSTSMSDTREGTPSESVPVSKLPTRLDQVEQLLGSDQVAFTKRLMEKNPVFAYRFGRLLDEDYVVFAENATWSREKWEERKKNEKLKPSGGAEPPPTTEAEEQKPPLWELKDWNAWLRPDLKAMPPDEADDEAREKFNKRIDFLSRMVGGTNLGESVRTGLNREVANMLQGIVVFSDGRSTEGTEEAFRELAERAARAEVPIFVVAVGEDRPRVKIEIADVRVPDQARPDDRFKTAVEVTGDGLADREFALNFDVTRRLVKGGKETPAEIVLVETHTNGTPTGKVVNLGRKVTLKPETPQTFKPGEPPRASTEFEIDPQSLAKAAGRLAELTPGAKYELEVTSDGESEDELVFQARVPKDRREIFEADEHVSDKVSVKVVKRPLRVLIVTSGGRDYQFTRAFLVREAQKRRAELSIYLQPAPGQNERRPGIVADVPPERLLSTFPDKLLAEEEVTNPEEKYYNLNAYDCILAFDPDWTRLNPIQIGVLEKWVGTHGGGLVVVGGPVNTIQLARPGSSADKLKPILTLYPVILEDARIQDERTATDPWKLNFPGASPEMEFLNLDEDKPDAKMLAGWDEFFYGETGGKAGVPLERGFYNYYPVKDTKPAATVVATFTDPRARLQNLKEQPYIVSQNYGAGKVVWLGSGELWRLRQYREAFHERFWMKLCRYVASGSTGKINKRILPQVGKQHPVNSYVRIDAQMYGRDMNPLPTTSKPKVRVKPPLGSEEKEMELTMTPRPGGDWNGFFTTRVLVKSPGDYDLEFKVDETGDTAPSKFSVKEVNPETDNTRPDIDRLFWLASDASKVIRRVDETTQKDLRERLVRPRLRDPDKAPADVNPDQAKEGQRLFFDLQNAELIPSCMITEEKEQRSRGAVVDLWDKGPMLDVATTITVLQWATIALAVGFAILGVITLVQWAGGQGNGMVNYLLLVGILLIAIGGVWIFFRWYQTTYAENASLGFGQNFLLAVSLLVIVGLLSLEWFIRKMLRLA